MKKYFLIFLIAIFNLFCRPRLTRAEEISIGIDPPILEITAQPGAYIREKFRVFGRAGDRIQISLESFQPKDELGQIEILDETDNPLIRRINFSEKKFILPQTLETSDQTNKEVVLFLNVPDDEPSGDYYLTIFVENRGPSPLWKETGGVTTTDQIAKIGLNLLLTITADKKLTPQAQITEFFTRPFYSQMPFEFTGRVQNTGKVRFKTYGNLVMKDIFNQKVVETELVPLNVLASSTRRLQNTLDDPGALHLSVPNITPLAKLLPNFYTVILKVNPDNSSQEVSAETRFIYCPVEFLIGILVLASLASILLIAVLRIHPQTTS